MPPPPQHQVPALPQQLPLAVCSHPPTCDLVLLQQEVDEAGKRRVASKLGRQSAAQLLLLQVERLQRQDGGEVARDAACRLERAGWALQPPACSGSTGGGAGQNHAVHSGELRHRPTDKSSERRLGQAAPNSQDFDAALLVTGHARPCAHRHTIVCHPACTGTEVRPKLVASSPASQRFDAAPSQRTTEPRALHASNRPTCNCVCRCIIVPVGDGILLSQKALLCSTGGIDSGRQIRQREERRRNAPPRPTSTCPAACPRALLRTSAQLWGSMAGLQGEKERMRHGSSPPTHGRSALTWFVPRRAITGRSKLAPAGPSGAWLASLPSARATQQGLGSSSCRSRSVIAGSKRGRASKGRTASAAQPLSTLNKDPPPPSWHVLTVKKVPRGSQGCPAADRSVHSAAWRPSQPSGRQAVLRHAVPPTRLPRLRHPPSQLC